MLDDETTAVAVGGAAAVAVVVTLCLRRLDAPAAQAPVQTAMHTMMMHTPIQMNGTRTAITIATMIPVDKLPTAGVKKVIIHMYTHSISIP